jgi:hypothetical protein
MFSKLTSNFLSIGNIAHANYVAHFFDIPLQGNNGNSGAYTERELCDALAHLFGYVFLDLETAQSFKNRVVAIRDTQRMGKVMEAAVANVKVQRFPLLKYMFSMGSSGPVLPSYGTQLVNRLLGNGKSIDEAVWTIIPTAAAASATQAQGVGYPLPLTWP